jgi:hypothetical protein
VTEEEARALAGYSSEPVIPFCGRDWKIRDDGMFALLTYVSADGEKSNPMAIVHRLLEMTVTSFAEFGDHAQQVKAKQEDIAVAAEYLVEFYCARPKWPAVRLLRFLAANFDEIDGMHLKGGGAGLTSLSVREACNLALAILLEGRTKDDREIFLEDLSYDGDPEGDALALVRQMQREKAAAAEAGRLDD